MSEPILKISDLSYHVKGKLLLDNVSLSVAKLDHVAIVGGNGAGKSTLFRAILKLLSVDAKKISIADSYVEELSRAQIARCVSYVPQTLNLSADYSVLDYLEMSCYTLGQASVKETVDSTLDRLQLQDFAKVSVMSLSGGERQRVSIAAAIVQQADIILLDEPTAHLDLYQAAKVKHWLAEVAKQENLTTLTITHDLNWVASGFTQAICLKDGAICYDGSAEGLIQHTRLQQYFGIDAEIVQRENGTPFIVNSVPNEGGRHEI